MLFYPCIGTAVLYQVHTTNWIRSGHARLECSGVAEQLPEKSVVRVDIALLGANSFHDRCRAVFSETHFFLTQPSGSVRPILRCDRQVQLEYQLILTSMIIHLDPLHSKLKQPVGAGMKVDFRSAHGQQQHDEADVRMHTVSCVAA